MLWKRYRDIAYPLYQIAHTALFLPVRHCHEGHTQEAKPVQGVYQAKDLHKKQSLLGSIATSLIHAWLHPFQRMMVHGAATFILLDHHTSLYRKQIVNQQLLRPWDAFSTVFNSSTNEFCQYSTIIINITIIPFH